MLNLDGSIKKSTNTILNLQFRNSTYPLLVALSSKLWEKAVYKLPL